MSMATGSMSRSRGRQEPSADINVTPLVDVMLVLLVIFMITAPTLQKDNFDVKLPQTKGGGAAGGRPATQQSVSIDDTGIVHFAGQKFSLRDAETQLPRLLAGRQQTPVILKAYRGLPYERVVALMYIIRQSGVKDILIAVETYSGAGAAAP